MFNMPHPCLRSADTGTSSALDAPADQAPLGQAPLGQADTQEDRLFAARLATLGELTASIAHEMNEPLAAIATQANACLLWLGRDEPDLPAAREGLMRIERAAMRAVDAIRGLVLLTRRSAPQRAEVDMNHAVAEVLALARSEIAQHGIRLDSRLIPANRPVLGDRVQLQQVVLALIMNSIESLRRTAGLPRVLSISTEPQSSGPQSSEAHGAGGVLVTVEDTGAGLDPAIADRVFDPLFTTKPGGMGMGLAIARAIIDGHGGRIWAAPRAPHGAVFRFILPWADEP
jgi:signal transduction histidine kinase